MFFNPSVLFLMFLKFQAGRKIKLQTKKLSSRRSGRDNGGRRGGGETEPDAHDAF